MRLLNGGWHQPGPRLSGCAVAACTRWGVSVGDAPVPPRRQVRYAARASAPRGWVSKGGWAMAWDWELLAGPDNAISEGPAWDGGGLFYTSIGNSEIRRYDPMGAP